MAEVIASMASALWLGILTSISPCPLATNIAAISYVGRRVDHPRAVFLSGLLYTLGRMLAYTVLAIVLVAGLQSVPQVSQLLQKYMNKALGPILILVGMVLCELIPLSFTGLRTPEAITKRIDSMGVWGAGVLGLIFAMSFCPISAALFFGSLIPLSIKFQSSVGLPGLYGLGTALPVFAFAVLLMFGTRIVGRAFDRISQIEWWSRRITGGIFIVVGIYFCLSYIFQIV